MATLFISHSNEDEAHARDMAERLRRLGLASFFLDFDPEAGIPAGTDWEQTLYDQLSACRAVIVLCSPRSMDSKWCFAEITLARSLDRLLFPVIIEPCTLPNALSGRQSVDPSQDGEQAYERLWSGLRKAGIDPSLASPPVPGSQGLRGGGRPGVFRP